MATETPETTQPNEPVELAALPPKLKQLWEKSVSALDIKNFDYTISLLQAVVKEEPGFLDGRKKLREAAIKKKEADTKRFSIPKGGGIGAMKIQPLVKKDPLAAIDHVEREVLAADPYNPQGNQLLFEAASRAGMPLTAGFALETLVQGNPDNVRYMHQLGDFYMEQGFWDQAAKVFAMVSSKDPTDLQANQKEKNATARATMAKQNYEGSVRDNLRDAGQAAQLEAQNRAGMTGDQLQQRIDTLLQRYTEDKNDLDAVKTLAALYEQKEDFENAIAFYEWAVHLSGGDVSLSQKLVAVRDTQRLRKLTEFEEWLEANPGHDDFEAVKADYASFKKQHFEAQIEDYRRQVDRNPTDNTLRFKFGEALFEAGNLKEAIPQLQRAQQSPSLRIRAMLMLGKCYEARNMNDLAIEQFKTAADELMTMDGTKKEVVYRLGLVHDKIGNKEEALDCMKQIYAVDYDYRDVADRVESSYA